MNGHADQNMEHKEISQKRLESEKRRLERMDEMRRMQEQRKMQISCALRAIDSPGAAAAMKRKSRKVFKSESEEDEEDTVPKRAKTEEALPSTLKLVNDDVYKRPVLEKSDPDTFMSKKLFGALGEEMVKKEMHFADDRFRLDERFIEEDEKQADSDEEQHHKEKLNELSILSRVLGKEVKSSLNTQAPSKQKTVCPFNRYDPDDPIHVKWLKEQQGENTSEDVGINTQTTKINDIVKGDLTEATIEGTFYNMDPEFAEELRKKNGKASTTEKNGFSFLSLMGRPEAAPVKPAPKVSLIDGQSSEDISQVKMPVFWQAPEEPLNWLKEVLERGVLDPEEAAHPIFAVDHKQEEIRSVVASFRRPKNAEHLSGSWKKTKEHFVQLSKSRKKLAVKNIQEKQFRPQKTDGSNDVPEKKKPSSACPKPDIPIASETRKKPNSFVRKSETRDLDIKPKRKRRRTKKDS